MDFDDRFDGDLYIWYERHSRWDDYAQTFKGADFGNIEAVLGGFGWHYNEIVAGYGKDPIVQYHKVGVTISQAS